MSRALNSLVAALLAATTSAVVLPGTAEAAGPAVKIYRVQFDSPGADRGSNASLNSEWVQIKNVSRSTQVLTGWTLKDKANHTFRFPSFSLRPGAVVTVHTGKGTASAANRYFNLTSYVWNNTGDTAYLRSARGTLVHSCAAAGKPKSC